MNEWKLTDDELLEAEGQGFKDWIRAGLPCNPLGHPLHESYQRRAVAGAAAKSLMAWISQHDCAMVMIVQGLEIDTGTLVLPPKYRQQLKEEIGI